MGVGIMKVGEGGEGEDGMCEGCVMLTLWGFRRSCSVLSLYYGLL